MEVASLVARSALALVFLTAGLSKLFVPDQFARVVRAYRVLPDGLIRPTAVWLPRIELACGVLLLLGIAQQVVAAAIALMLVSFIGAAAWSLLHGREIDCGCFGVSRRRQITWLTVGENLLLLLAAAIVVAQPAQASGFRILFRSGARTSESEALAVLISTTLVLVGIVMSSEARRLWLAFRATSVSDGGAG